MRKNKSIFIYPLVVCMMAGGCKKSGDTAINSNPVVPTPTKTVPSLTTVAITNITQTTASSGGYISDNGGSNVTSRGLCWGTSSMPTTSNSKTSDGLGTGSYTSSMTALTKNTTYYVRAYSVNSSGIGYGNQVSFTTANSTLAPCTPPSNSCIFNMTTQHFNSVNAGTTGLSYGSYGIVGNGPSSDLVIEFSQAPESGNYTTIDASSFINNTQCVIHGVFGGTFSYEYSVSAGYTVYVTKSGTDKYSMTFCTVHFASGSTSITFTTDGNLSTP